MHGTPVLAVRGHIFAPPGPEMINMVRAALRSAIAETRVDGVRTPDWLIPYTGEVATLLVERAMEHGDVLVMYEVFRTEQHIVKLRVSDRSAYSPVAKAPVAFLDGLHVDHVSVHDHVEGDHIVGETISLTIGLSEPPQGARKPQSFGKVVTEREARNAEVHGVPRNLYVRLRDKGLSHVQVINLVKRKIVLDHYLAAREVATHAQVLAVISAGIDLPAYTRARENNATHGRILSNHSRGIPPEQAHPKGN